MRDRVSPRRCLRPMVAAAVCAVLLTLPSGAGAIVSDVQPIDGPSGEVIDVGESLLATATVEANGSLTLAGVAQDLKQR